MVINEPAVLISAAAHGVVRGGRPARKRVLLLGAPDWWLENGREIRIERAPTHFGTMNLHLRGTAAGVEVKLDPPHRQPPKRIVLHLPNSHPVVRAPKGVNVVYRPDDAHRWDFPTIVEAYRKLPAPSLHLDK